MADGDPDVDAIYRLIYKDELLFEKKSPVILEKGSWCSFNSQNTLFLKSFFPALYLPCHVSFRMTDIWRSFVAQAVLWSEGKKLCFGPATVKQIRNQHDLMHDFKDEIDGYLGNKEICSILEKEAEKWTLSSTIADKIQSAWQTLYQHKFIEERELTILSHWMKITQAT